MAVSVKVLFAPWGLEWKYFKFLKNSDFAKEGVPKSKSARK
jgi:hypothetical protein